MRRTFALLLVVLSRSRGATAFAKPGNAATADGGVPPRFARSCDIVSTVGIAPAIVSRRKVVRAAQPERVLTRFRECNVGQPILAAAAFQAASFAGKRGLSFATTGSFSVLEHEPPRKAA